MALYKQLHNALLFPYQYVESTGSEAKHFTKDDDKALNERGKPKMEYASLWSGQNRLLYENKADYDQLSDADKANAFWATDSNLLARFEERGAIEKVENYSK
jgi:hypothetical protein